MKVYTITVVQERAGLWGGAARVQIIGTQGAHAALYADGNGAGSDPIEAASDAMAAAELGLPPDVREVTA